jgi:hypothetical protein
MNGEETKKPTRPEFGVRRGSGALQSAALFGASESGAAHRTPNERCGIACSLSSVRFFAV